MKTHIKTVHKGQRNYRCDSCEKTFTQSGDLKRHINIIHSIIVRHELTNTMMWLYYMMYRGVLKKVVLDFSTSAEIQYYFFNTPLQTKFMIFVWSGVLKKW